MKRLTALASFTLLFGTLAFTQPPTPTIYEPFGGAGLELNRYEPVEGYEAGVNDAEVGGNLILQIDQPRDRAVTVVLVGPDGYRQSAEVQREELFERLKPGVYALAATASGLQPVIGKVEVVLGRNAPAEVTLNRTLSAPYDVGVFDYEPYGGFESATEPAEAGDTGGAGGTGGLGADTGSLSVQVSAGEGEIFSSITGPDGYRQDFTTEASLEGLAPGAYAVASAAEGRAMTQGVVEVRSGEKAAVVVTLEPLRNE